MSRLYVAGLLSPTRRARSLNDVGREKCPMTSVNKVHEALQLAFGSIRSAQAIRSHRCDLSTVRLPRPDGGFPAERCGESEAKDEEDCTLEQLSRDRGRDRLTRLRLRVGDCWLHRLELVACRCWNQTGLASRAACPRPACRLRRLPGYGQTLDVLTEPGHPDPGDVAEWGRRGHRHRRARRSRPSGH